MEHLDDINLSLLELLLENGRMSYRELGERVGLSAPAVTERVHKLEERGIITGYRATINEEALGFPLFCIIRLNVPPKALSDEIDRTLEAIPEVIEANRVTGSESHVIRARVRDTAHLEELLSRLWNHSDSVTSIVTSSAVPHRPMRLRQAYKR
ncbi:MAG: AsnC family transcriptional regulator [Ilumatobacter coccineus]|uniref:AsnC family transcriptional regulator n=1 Tax=Ilumatobacter coccineus TaxID=467094 RepID=A0A2G6K7H7_9ACTN|nr:MAG: AsnC family transcriptional regulator [Ilumatobacter coccineus]